jgi:hypothetical protein
MDLNTDFQVQHARSGGIVTVDEHSQGTTIVAVVGKIALETNQDALTGKDSQRTWPDAQAVAACLKPRDANDGLRRVGHEHRFPGRRAGRHDAEVDAPGDKRRPLMSD